MRLWTRRRRARGSGNPNRSRHSALVAVPSAEQRALPASESERAALVAAGFKIRRRDGDTLRRLILPWQPRSFAYYDLLGEIKYAAQFYARLLGPLRLYVEELDAKGDWVESKDKDAIDALERIKDPGGTGRSGLLEAYGRLMFLNGECYLFVTIDPDTEQEQWEMLSTDELRPIGSTYIRYKAPSLQAEEFHEPDDDTFTPSVDQYGAIDKSAVAYRLWQRHPRFSMYADCTMQGVLDICEELVLLTQAIRSRARSRLAGSGILFVSDDFSMGPLEPSPGEDPDEDPFLSDLTDAMTKPIADEGAASAVVPLVVRGPTEAIDKGVRHVQIIDPTQVYPETGLRIELIKRLAIGLDMPPEQLLGMTDANHWTGWMIDEQTWKNHGLPKAIQLCNDLNQAYFAPYLREEAGRKDWASFRIGFDPSTVINHPDRTKDAKDLYDKNIVGKRYVREACGIDEDAAPTIEESAERIGILVRDASLAWYGIPSVKAGGIEPEPGQIESGSGSASEPAASSGAEVEPGPPAAGPDDEAAEAVVASAERILFSQAARIAGAAELGLHRAREVAGNRLKGLAKRDPEALKLVEGARAGQVAAVLGRARVRGLRAPDERELVAGARDLVLDALRVWDVHPSVADIVVELVETHAIRTLYMENPGGIPDVWTARIAGALTAAR